jgi:hypothetical protein
MRARAVDLKSSTFLRVCEQWRKISFVPGGIMLRLPSSSVEGIRFCVHPDYSGLSSDDLESIVESSIAGMTSGTAEDFMSSLSSFGKSAVPVLERAAPDVAKGAAAGSTFGPWGAVIGAGAGLASSLLKSQGKPAPAQASTPSAASATPRQAEMPAVAQGAAPPAPLPTGQGAAATLVGLLQNPTVQQALISQVLGASGKEQVQTASGTSVPRGAINALLTQLLSLASEALPEWESVSEGYLKDSAGGYLIDPASHDQHAALVLSYLQPHSSSRDSPDNEAMRNPEAFQTEFSEDWPEVDESIEATFY